MVCRKGLGCCYIKSSRSDLSRGQSLVELFLVHHGSPEQCRLHSVFTHIKSIMPIWSKVSQDLLEFTKTAVFFILLKNSLLHIPCVSGVREQEITMKSLSARSVSRGTVGVNQHKESDSHIWVRRSDPSFLYTLIAFLLTKLSFYLSSFGLGGSPRVQQPLHSEGQESACNGHAFRKRQPHTQP